MERAERVTSVELPGEVSDRSVTIYMTGALCTQPAQIFQTWQARGVIQSFLNHLRRRESAEALLRHLLADLPPQRDL